MSKSSVKQLVEKYPLSVVMGVAIGLRLLSVLFSKGFMASDDHFQTVRIVCDWLVNGEYDIDGNLVWAGKSAETVARNPLYTLLLYGMMKPLYSMGVTSLDGLMYVVRFAHASLSLVGVWAVYRITARITKAKYWAFGAGLLAAAHFALPFLSVRNLIEMVGSNFWILSLFFLYPREEVDANRSLIVSGLFAGIGWMFRFQLAAAAIAVPLALWWQKRSIKPAVFWSVGFLVIFLFSGLFEYTLLGRWWGGTFGHLEQGTREGSLYNTSHFIYVGVLLAMFFPPVSLVLGYLTARKQLWREHLPLLLSTVSFIILHTIQQNRQERFMIPLLYPLIVIFTLTLWYTVKAKGWWVQGKRIRGLLIYAGILNLILLPLFTMNYGHKGEVEPLVRLENRPKESVVVFFTPETRRIFPFDYATIGAPRRISFHKWIEFDTLVIPDTLSTGPFYCLVYPPTPEKKEAYIDSLGKIFEAPVMVDYVAPSTIDYLLHVMNPKHNKTHEAWIYKSERLTEGAKQKQEAYKAIQSQVMNSP